MKNHITFIVTFLFIFPTLLFAQKSNFTFRPILGTRIFDDKELGSLSHNQRRRFNTAFAFGFEAQSTKHPITLSFQREYWGMLWPFNYSNDIYTTVPSFFFTSRRTDNIIIYRKKNNFTYGVGHYWRTIEDIAHHLFSGVTTRYRGFNLSISRSFSWLDIEFRREINYSPGFDLLGTSLSSLHFMYRIGGNKNGETENSKNNKDIVVNGILGSRFFRTKDIRTVPGEKLDFIGVAPVFGIEFYSKKHKLSFNVDKDLWASVNTGSFTRNLKGYISNTTLGIKHHIILENGHHARFGLGATWVDDFQNQRDYREGISEAPASKLRYTDFGISANVSYEFVENWDIEMRHVFTLIRDESPLTLRRLSVGLIYRLNPYR